MIEINSNSTDTVRLPSLDSTTGQTKTIGLTGGGTAGHVMPHLALLPYLEKHFAKIYYIGSFNGIEREIIAKYPSIEYFAVTTVKLRRSIDLRNLAIPFKLVKGISEAKKLLKRLKPDIVFSKGGFVAYPVARAAAKLKIPVVAHESDMSMGLANRLCAKYCKTICTTFAKTAQAHKDTKYIHTGSPIRAQLFGGKTETINERHKTDTAKSNLLVTGGSLGATRVNESVRTALDELLKSFNIIHLCGRGKVDESIKKPNYIQLEFVGDIENYFAWADVVVSRAGSNSLCELMVLKKPTLFVPLSRAQSRGDQIENAAEIQELDAGMVLSDEELDSKNLIHNLRHLLVNKEMYKQHSARLGDLNGTEKIAQIITQQAQTKYQAKTAKT